MCPVGHPDVVVVYLLAVELCLADSPSSGHLDILYLSCISYMNVSVYLANHEACLLLSVRIKRVSSECDLL